MITATLILSLSVAIALLQGIGGALEKKGISQVLRKVGPGGFSPRTLMSRMPDIMSAVITTPIFLVGLVMVTILGGGLFMVALSLGDGAKVGLFVAALASGCYLAANMIINGEQIRPLHVIGIACAMSGAVFIALAGFRVGA